MSENIASGRLKAGGMVSLFKMIISAITKETIINVSMESEKGIALPSASLRKLFGQN